MPALPAVPGVLKVNLLYHASNDLNLVNNLFFRYNGTPPSNSVLTTWAGALSASWATNMGPLHHPSVALNAITVTDLSDPSAGIGQNPGLHAGTRTGTALPAGTCALVNYVIQRRYRGGKPRTYLPAGISNDVLDGQKWSTTFTGALLTGFNAFVASAVQAPPSGTSGLLQVMVSYYHGFTVHTGSTGRAKNIPTLRAGGPLIDLLFTPSIDPEFASQRRRNRP